MPEADRSRADVGRTGRRVEQAGVALMLGALGFYLWIAQDLIAWSDPAKWFEFGRHFAEGFGQAKLAYAFPLVVHVAIQAVGLQWAFLVNLPLLVALAGLLYAFARELAPRRLGEAGLGALAGGVAVALLVWRNRELLLDLCSPYRDPLSYVFVLLACLLLMRQRRAPEAPPVWVAAAGASLALACSTRETSALLLGPFALYGLMLRREVPLLRSALVFGASFALFCIPMLVHNHGVTGHFWVPAQAAPSFAAEGSITPGVRAEQLDEGFPLVLAHTWGHFGWPVAVLAAVGLASALRRRQAEVLAICAPAFVLYLVFYGGYTRVVDRYLFVLDLFALPVAGYGAATLVAPLLRPLGAGRLGRALAATAGLAASVVAGLVALDASRDAREGFRIDDARALAHHVGALVPDDAPLLGEPPLVDILRCFLDDDARIIRLRRRAVFGDPDFRQRIREEVRKAGTGYAVLQRPALASYVRSQFDVENVATFRASTYRLQRTLERLFFVDRLAPWSQFETLATLEPQRPGPRLLMVDVGQLSAEPRGFARVSWGDQILDESPRDGPNYYAIRIDDPSARLIVRLASDRPVPSQLEVALRGIRSPIDLDFDLESEFHDLQRLGPSFATASGRFPALRGEGTIDVPTVGWHDAVFVGVAKVNVRSGPERGRRELVIGADGRPFQRVRLAAPAGEEDGGGGQSRISFAFYEPLVKADETRLLWQYDAPDDPAEALALRSLSIHRRELSPDLLIDLGGNDELFLVGGFGPRESPHEPESLTWRAVEARAELRLPLKPDPRPARLRVRYLTGVRPTPEPPPVPTVTWNGVPLFGAVREQALGELTAVTLEFELQAAFLERVVNQLVITCDAWRDHDIVLDRVTLERVVPG